MLVPEPLEARGRGTRSQEGTEPAHEAPAKAVLLASWPADSELVTQLLADLLSKGRDLERVVLARAVRFHLENRVAVCGNRTVVFG